MIRLFTFGLFLLTAACATVGPQTKRLIASPPEARPQTEIQGVPFVSQVRNNCGPSTLKMAFAFVGNPTSIEQLDAEVFTKEKDGTLPMDMISAARRHGLMAVQLHDLRDIIREVDAGHPVITLENLGLSWYPQWHYSLIFGYDLSSQDFLIHSGQTPGQKKTFNYFERGWALADHWAIVVIPPSTLAVSAGELEHLKAAAGIELAQQFAAAELAYQSILKRWPNSLGARIGLANLAFRERNYARAVQLLKQAATLDPTSKTVQHNLKVALSALKKP